VLADSYPIWMNSQPDITWLILVASGIISWDNQVERLAVNDMSLETLEHSQK
jgi:hypothetical protein